MGGSSGLEDPRSPGIEDRPCGALLETLTLLGMPASLPQPGMWSAASAKAPQPVPGSACADPWGCPNITCDLGLHQPLAVKVMEHRTRM